MTAAKDLVRDLTNKLGAGTVEIASEVDPAASSIFVATGTDRILSAPLVQAPEGHQVFTFSAGNKHVLLQGADVLGTVYAIYTFSEFMVGVPPLWYWATGNSAGYFPPGSPPPPVSEIVVPENGCVLVAPPETKYRAFFRNDAGDYFYNHLPTTDWIKNSDSFPNDEKEKRTSLLLETLLRLKLNVVHDPRIVETADNIVDTARTIWAARDRGLIYIRDWGSMSYRDWWLRTKILASGGPVQYEPGHAGEFDYIVVPKVALDPLFDASVLDQPGCAVAPGASSDLAAAWKWSADFVASKYQGSPTNAYTAADTFWFLGMRALRDGHDMFKDLGMPTSWDDRARIEIKAIRCQRAALKETLGTSSPRVAVHLWDGMEELYQNSSRFRDAFKPGGALSGITLTFANNYRTNSPNKSVTEFTVPTSEFTGYYHNLQFTSTGSHIADGGGPWKAVQSLKYAQDRVTSGAGASSAVGLRFAMINIGNMREFLLSGSVVADALWDINGFSPTHGVRHVFDTYFPGKGMDLADLYREYLDAYWQQAPSSVPSSVERQWIWTDLRQSGAIDALLGDIAANKPLGTVDSGNLDRYGIFLPFGNTEVAAMVQGLSMTSSTKGAVFRWRDVLARQSSSDRAASVDLQTLRAGITTNLPLLSLIFDVPIGASIQSSRANYFVARARQKRAANDLTGAAQALNDALEALSSMDAELNKGNFGEFSRWYEKDRDEDDGWARCARQRMIQAVREKCVKSSPDPECSPYSDLQSAVLTGYECPGAAP